MEESVEQLRELHMGKWVGGGGARSSQGRGQCKLPGRAKFIVSRISSDLLPFHDEVTAFEELCSIKGNM